MTNSCTICTTLLIGRQRKFCSRKCKNSDTNHQHQSYVVQQARGLALTWHHLDPALKLFNLDIRSLSNRSDRAVQAEVAKCILLCSNCHAETHFPRFDRSPGIGLRRPAARHSTGT